MDRAVSQALNNLVPALNGPLPNELLALATSLLAQSRNKASSLKAEEEIARTYACANLACERLKLKLALPKIQPSPPCPPKVYRKLYSHFDTTLSVGIRKSARPPRNPDSTDAPTSSPAKPKTPSKTRVIATTTPRSKREERKAIAAEVPPWVMKAIRSLCKSLDAPAAAPHIFAGVSSILTIPSPSEDLIPDSELVILRELGTMALIVAVYLFVRARLSGKELAEKDYKPQRNQAIKILGLAHILNESCDPRHVDKWMREISSRGWAALDWFQNVRVGAGLGVERSNEEAGQSDGDEDDGTGMLLKEKIDLDSLSTEKPYLQIGLGTMMQDKVDYLSDERRVDFQKWKKAILLRIEEVEKQHIMDTADE